MRRSQKYVSAILIVKGHSLKVTNDLASSSDDEQALARSTETTVFQLSTHSVWHEFSAQYSLGMTRMDFLKSLMQWESMLSKTVLQTSYPQPVWT